jgi:4-hydroxybenzoate polyprenyltransferase
MLCYAMSLMLITAVGLNHGLSHGFLLGMLVAAGIAVYHWFLIRDRDRVRCFAAFRHNNWLGAAVFAGIALG